MKVLWLSHLIPFPPKGGVLQRSHHLLKELAKYHEVDLLAFNQKALLKNIYTDLDQGLKEANEFLSSVCNKHKIVDIPSDKTSYGRYLVALKSIIKLQAYNTNWLYSNEFKTILKNWTSNKSYDLVHFDTIGLVPYRKYISGSAIALDHHNIESHMLFRRASKEKNLFMEYYYKIEAYFLMRYEKKHCHSFDINITCSELDAERLIKLSPETKAVSIPNGVDIEYFRYDESKSEEQSIIFVGRLNWYPNREAVLFLAKLWPQLKKRFPNIKCHIVGSNPPDQLITLGKNDSDFKVHGFVNDFRPLMRDCPIYVCPITDGGGTKLKIIDALAMGKAIVAHPIACEGISVTNNTNVLFAENEEQYLSCIEKLLGDSQYRTKFQVSARELACKTYSYKIIGKQLSELYSSISVK